MNLTHTHIKLLSNSENKSVDFDLLVSMINAVFEVAEGGLWQPGYLRTTPNDFADMVNKKEIVVAEFKDRIVGLVRLETISEKLSKFGMLTVKPEYEGRGIGGKLVDYAEDLARERGSNKMRLELLSPKEWTHDGKNMLESWYTREGYVPIERLSFEDVYPEEAPKLCTPCYFTLYEKTL